MNELKACRECKHCEAPNINTNTVRCTSPDVGENIMNYYTGKMVFAYPSIDIARTIGACKPEARFWEPKY